MLGYVFYKHTSLNLQSLWILSLSIWLSFFISSILDSIIIKHEPIKGKIAWIDISHGERCELTSLQPDSIGGLITTLLRCGYLPMLLRSSIKKELSNNGGEILILISPTKKFTEKEINVIKEFIRNGGLVTLCVDWEGKEASKPLLNAYGLEVMNVPLGPVPIIKHDPKEVQFVEAWPIVSTLNKLLSDVKNVYPGIGISQPSQGPFPQLPGYIQKSILPDAVLSIVPNLPYSHSVGQSIHEHIFYPEKSFLDSGLLQPLLEKEQSLRVLYQTEEGLSLVVFKPDGKGGLLVIGDRHFLGDANLENMNYYREGNILFLKKLFCDIIRR
jgi:hypothetical protein